MTKQQQTGKAFECALADALCASVMNSRLVHDTAYEITRRALDGMTAAERQMYVKAAVAAVKHIMELEPVLSGEDLITIGIQKDSIGQQGDVRDIITIRDNDGWKIGFSAKNNSAVVKNPRLSSSIDFGRNWVGIPCSQQYMDSVKVVFDRIRELMQSGVVNWRDVPNKNDSIYKPILDAFRRELRTLAEHDPHVPENLVRYVVGRHDFYKIMKRDQQHVVRIEGYNLNGTLNKGSVGGVKVKRLKMPARLREVVTKGRTRVLVSLDEGWEFSFRIHSAETKLIPSLKFDIQLVGAPILLYSNDRHWKDNV